MTTASQHFDDAFQPRPLVRGPGRTLFGPLTIWLLLAMAVGLWIGISDGLTRDFMTEAEVLGPAESLQYEPFKAAWVLAAAVFPLILIHGRKLRMRIAESLLLWFALCTAAYTKDFAYLKVPGAPLYVTDLILALTLISLFLWPRLRIPKLNFAMPWALLLMLLIGVLGAARGIVGGQDRLDVLRDFSIFGYMLFLLPSFYSRRSKELSEQFCLMTVCGAVISTLIGVSWYLAQPGMRRYINYITVPLAFILIIVALVNRRLKPHVAIPLLLLMGMGILVSNTRSTFLVLALTMVIMVAIGARKRRWKDALKPALIGLVALTIAVGAVLQTRQGADFVSRISGQVVDLLLHGTGDDNAYWRLLAWAEAGRRFLAQPILGEGFGIPLTTELTTVGDVKPHNIYITVLYKTGVVGFAGFLFLLLPPVFTAWRVLRRHGNHPDAVLLRGLFLCQLFSMGFGAINPLIESPFLASMFWLNMGFMLSIARRIRKDSELELPPVRIHS